jgi:ribosomal protein S18 acetylase RimI-like enzyme
MPDADAVTDALLDDWARICETLGKPAFRRATERAAALVSGAPAAPLNNVFTARIDASRFEVEALLRLVAETGLPHSLQVRPGTDPELVALPHDRGMTDGARIPLMVLDAGVAASVESALGSQMIIRRLAPEEAPLHASLLEAGFGLPSLVFQQIMTPAVCALPGANCYVGSLDGHPVSTAFGFANGDHVGIYNVAIRPEHRGRGCGATITARAVMDGFAAGASYAFLQSSMLGYRLFERLGFRELESWTVWSAS